MSDDTTTSTKNGFSSIHDLKTFAEKFPHAVLGGYNPDLDRAQFEFTDLEFTEIIVPIMKHLNHLDSCITINNEKSRYFHMVGLFSWLVGIGKFQASDTFNSWDIDTDTEKVKANESDLMPEETFLFDPNSLFITHENTMSSTSKVARGPIELIITQGNLLKLNNACNKQPSASTTPAKGSQNGSGGKPPSRGAINSSPVASPTEVKSITGSVSSGTRKSATGIAAMDKPKRGRIAFVSEIKDGLESEAELENPVANPMFQIASQLCVAVEINRSHGDSSPIYGALSNGFDFYLMKADPQGLGSNGPIHITRGHRLTLCVKHSVSDRLYKPTKDTRSLITLLIHHILADTCPKTTSEVVQAVQKFNRFTSHTAQQFADQDNDFHKPSATEEQLRADNKRLMAEIDSLRTQMAAEKIATNNGEGESDGVTKKRKLAHIEGEGVQSDSSLPSSSSSAFTKSGGIDTALDGANSDTTTTVLIAAHEDSV